MDTARLADLRRRRRGVPVDPPHFNRHRGHHWHWNLGDKVCSCGEDRRWAGASIAVPIEFMTSPLCGVDAWLEGQASCEECGERGVTFYGPRDN